MTQSNIPDNQNVDEVSKLRKSLTDLSKLVERLGVFQTNQIRPLKLLNWVGYGLLIFALFDIIEIFLTYRPGAEWQFQTLGQVIERVAVPLIGFGLAFLGSNTVRSKAEYTWVKVLSWATIVLAVLFILSLPLGIFNTVRIYRGLTQAVTLQEQQQTTQAQAQAKVLKEALDNIQTPEEWQAFMIRLTRQQQAIKLEDPDKVQDAKNQLSAQVDNKINQIPIQAQKVLSQRRQALIKSSIKWNLSALISGFLFFFFWKETPWARQQR